MWLGTQGKEWRVGATVLDGETGKGMELGLRDKEGCPEKGLHIYLYCFLSRKRKTK